MANFKFLLKLNAYSYQLKVKTEEKFSARSQFQNTFVKMTRACDIHNKLIQRKKRQRLVICLNKWKLAALFEMSKEAMKENIINSHRESQNNALRQSSQHNPLRMKNISEKAYLIGFNLLQGIFEKPKASFYVSESKQIVQLKQKFMQWKLRTISKKTQKTS